MQALQFMLSQYDTLKVLSTIAENTTKPTRYQCTPRELILGSQADWKQIQADLTKLEQESLVEISHAATPSFCITEKGLKKILALEGRSY
jgi:predicted transcriptional regulator